LRQPLQPISAVSDASSNFNPPPSKRHKLSARGINTRNHILFDDDLVWIPMLEEYHAKNIADNWKQQSVFIMNYLDTHHANDIKVKRGYPGRRTFGDKLKQYRKENHIVTTHEFEYLQSSRPKSSVIHQCNHKQILFDDNNNPLILFHCGHTKKLSLLDAKNKNGKPLIPVEQKNPTSDCPDCLARRHCETLQNQANYEVKKVLQRFEKSYLFDWMNGSNQLTKTCNVLLDKVVIPNELKIDPGYKEITQQLKLKVMDLPSVVANIDDNELKLLKDKLVGGFYPESYEMPKSKIVGFAPRSTIGVLKWQFNDNVYNYAIIDKVNLDDTTIVEYGRIANREKISGCRFARSGKAAGINPPPLDERYDPTRFSFATKNTPRIHFATKKGFGTAYTSTNPRDKSRPDVSFEPRQDIDGEKLSCNEKRDLLLKCEIMRCVTINKLQSRLRALTIIESLQLDDVSGIWADIKATMNVAVQSETINKWHEVDDTLNLWDIVFLEWACLSEEVWNFMAVAFHEDGNNRDFETMMIMGLVEDNNLRPHVSSIAKGMVRGLTVLPFQGIALESQPGRTVIHMRLDRSLHAADGTRNRVNFAVLTSYERRRLRVAARDAGIV
jgi:hypothetical protein